MASENHQVIGFAILMQDESGRHFIAFSHDVKEAVITYSESGDPFFDVHMKGSVIRFVESWYMPEFHNTFADPRRIRMPSIRLDGNDETEQTPD